MRLLIALPLSFVLCIGALPQTKTLRPDKPVKLSAKLGSNDAVANDGMCDRSGNTFVTIYDPEINDGADRPLLKFDKSGSLKGEFPGSRKSFGPSEIEGRFELSALLSSGGIARLAWSRDAMYLTRFAGDGKLDSRIKLDGPAIPIVPYQLAAFPSGEVLVSGVEGCRSRRCFSGYKSFTAIYDQGGHLQKRLSIPEEDEIDAAAAIGDSRYAQGPMFGNRAVTGGKARLGDDGNVYLMRRTSPATIYVISSSGNLVRTLTVQSLRDGWMSVDFQVSDEKIAINFSNCSMSRCEGSIFAVANAVSGQKLTDYADDPHLGQFACYASSPERFTFLAISEKNLLEITDAQAK